MNSYRKIFETPQYYVAVANGDIITTGGWVVIKDGGLFVCRKDSKADWGEPISEEKAQRLYGLFSINNPYGNMAVCHIAIARVETYPN